MERMHRRCFDWDYRGRAIYMVTVTAFEHRPLFGELVGGEARPEIRRSALGEMVARCWEELPTRYPGVRLLASVVMPDHFHGVLFVQKAQEKPLGAMVGFLKAHTTSLFLHGASAMAQDTTHGASAPAQGTASAMAQGTASAMAQDTTHGASAMAQDTTHGASAPAQGGPAQGVLWPAACGGRRPIWAPGYHDRILFRRGQLERMVAYVRDNPRRLAVKRAHPELFRVVRDLSLAGQPFTGIGNHFLLQWPVRVPIQCSRKLSAEALARRQSALLALARKGAVLISPCISPGEKQIARAAMEEGLPLVVLLENGFPPLYKPPKAYFEACAQGRLLMLAPWPHHAGRCAITRERCLALNALAKRLSTEEVCA